MAITGAGLALLLSSCDPNEGCFTKTTATIERTYGPPYYKTELVCPSGGGGYDPGPKKE